MYKAKEAYQSIDKTDENADTLKDLLDKNPETWEFVKNYSKMKDASPADTIGEVAAGEIPLLLQWDERWGYSVYGDNMDRSQRMWTDGGRYGCFRTAL